MYSYLSIQYDSFISNIQKRRNQFYFGGATLTTIASVCGRDPPIYTRVGGTLPDFGSLRNPFGLEISLLLKYEARIIFRLYKMFHVIKIQHCGAHDTYVFNVKT